MYVYTNKQFPNEIACIGIFWLTKDCKQILASFKQPIVTGENYGEFKISQFEHAKVWNKVNKDLNLHCDNYTEYPRGRLTYNKDKKSVMVIGGTWIHNKEVQKLLIDEFHLVNVDYYFRDEGKDAHYRDFSK